MERHNFYLHEFLVRSQSPWLYASPGAVEKAHCPTMQCARCNYESPCFGLREDVEVLTTVLKISWQNHPLSPSFHARMWKWHIKLKVCKFLRLHEEVGSVSCAHWGFYFLVAGRTMGWRWRWPPSWLPRAPRQSSNRPTRHTLKCPIYLNDLQLNSPFQSWLTECRRVELKVG